MHTVARFEVVRARRTREFLEQVAVALSDDAEMVEGAERVEGVTVEDGQQRGSLPWLRVPTATGHVEVWNGAEVGQHGLFIGAYEFADEHRQHVCFVGDFVRVVEDGGVGETVALLRSYLAGPSVAGRAERRDLRRRLAEALQVEEGQL